MNTAEKVYKQALDYALKKIEKNMTVLRDSFPFVTVNGKWESCKEDDWDLGTFKDGYWCNGFWTGMLWLMYKHTKEDKFKNKAYELCKLIEPRKDSNIIHDLGFLFYPSFCIGYDITKDDYFKSVAMTAADSLLSRFNDKIGAITVFGDTKDSGLTAIDTMMNLPLLWWSYEKTGDKRYYDAACKHAFTTLQYFVRDDGSTYHVVEFDPNNGQVVRRGTLQGYNDDSCWSRGHAWAIYGFAIAYKNAKKNEFLLTAEKLTEYYLANCPSDYVPYWDFNVLEIPNEVRDSSAAAITACGLLEFNGKKEFGDIAPNILDSICTGYLAEEDKDGILKHGCFNKPKEKGIDESLIWGDYYFMELVTKLLEEDVNR
jgi:unsaturated chondroitin disaccharide hydrolase